MAISVFIREGLSHEEKSVRIVLLFGFAPGDAYPAIHVAMHAVGSYPTISPLPPEEGGLFSAALSVR